MKLKYTFGRQRSSLGYGSRLILIVSIHIVIIALNGYIAYHGINIMKFDAEVINKTGVIRGNAQKVCKLELSGIPDDDEIYQINAIFEDFLNFDKQILGSRNMESFILRLQQLQKEWITLKKHIHEYRKDKSEVNNSKLLENSERFWDSANLTVGLAQELSESKLSTFRLMFAVFFIDFLLIIAIILLINSIVRNNLEKITRTDSLTGINNRTVYNEHISLEMERSIRYGDTFSLLLIDIDFFKNINDSYGHDEGDRVLISFCNLILESTRKSDVFCRFGGEEFVIIATHTDAENALKLANNLCNKIRQNMNGITISIGITEWKIGDTKNSIFKRADEAMYKSKREGRDRATLA